MPPKNMISVTRNTHIPRVTASFCCAIVSKWCCSRVDAGACGAVSQNRVRQP